VRMNRASKSAYRDIWGVLSKQLLEYEEQRAPADDILDTPPAKTPSYSLPDLAAAEDKIDQDDHSGSDGNGNAPVNPAANDEGSDHEGVPFSMDDVAGMPF